MKSPFAGRSLAVINDFTVDEQLYLYQKTKLLKESLLQHQNVDSFRINDSEMSYYLIFLEDSTRTKESFRNACAFHNGRVNVFEAGSSSFNKKESITDTIKMLMGYSSRSSFIIRSRQEGLCRWLNDSMQDYALRSGMQAPIFINAGDGRHEHPTQEMLDEFTFLEHLKWSRESIHIALVGDLFHGRTVHSKVDGLKIFHRVEVDLVAPPLLGLPSHLVHRMEANGYTVHLYPSIDDYLNQEPDNIAELWYFTRLQLERMGEEVKEHAPLLRRAVTFREDLLRRLKPDTCFYHPLPRHRETPVVPTFLDKTALNGWDRQSVNGYYTRIVLIALLNGLFGDDFTGQVHTDESFADNFIEEVDLVGRKSNSHSDMKMGMKPVDNGIVIDHIAKGTDLQKIWNHIDKVRLMMGLNYRSSHGVYHCSDRTRFKGIISLPGIMSFSEKDLKKLAAICPGCTLNLVKEAKVIQKYRLNSPPRVYGFKEISCKNENCISHKDFCEPIEPDFIRASDGSYVCRYCEKPHHYSEIWDL